MRIPGISFWTPKQEIARLCEPFLEPGEQITHVLIGFQSILEAHWAIVATDRAILLLDPGLLRPGIARWVLGQEVQRLPRSTRLGPIYGQGWVVIDGQRFFIPGSRRTIAAIDAEAGAPPL